MLRLLTRTTRSASPTQAGERLLQTAGHRFDEIQAGLIDIVAQRYDAGVRGGEQVARDMIAKVRVEGQLTCDTGADAVTRAQRNPAGRCAPVYNSG
jgi:hypothetical protein